MIDDVENKLSEGEIIFHMPKYFASLFILWRIACFADYYGAPQRSNDYGYNQNNNQVWQQGGGRDRGNWNSGQDRYSRDLSSNRNNANDRYSYRGDVDYRDAQRYTRTDVDSRPRQADQDLMIAPEDFLYVT